MSQPPKQRHLPPCPPCQHLSCHHCPCLPGAMAPSAVPYSLDASAAASAAAGGGFAGATACAAPSMQLLTAHFPGGHHESASSMSESSSAGSLGSLAQSAPGILPPAALGNALEGAAAAEPPSPTDARRRFAYATLLTRCSALPACAYALAWLLARLVALARPGPPAGYSMGHQDTYALCCSR